MESKQSSSMKGLAPKTRTKTRPKTTITFSLAPATRARSKKVLQELDIVKLILQRDDLVNRLKQQNNIVLKEKEKEQQMAKEMKTDTEEETSPAPEADNNVQAQLRLLLEILSTTRAVTIKLVPLLANWQDAVGAPFQWFVSTTITK